MISKAWVDFQRLVVFVRICFRIITQVGSVLSSMSLVGVQYFVEIHRLLPIVSSHLSKEWSDFWSLFEFLYFPEGEYCAVRPWGTLWCTGALTRRRIFQITRINRRTHPRIVNTIFSIDDSCWIPFGMMSTHPKAFQANLTCSYEMLSHLTLLYAFQ